VGDSFLRKEKPRKGCSQGRHRAARVFGVSVRTAQRWEKSDRLPVYHQGEGRKSRIFAYEHELLAWRARGARRASEDPALEGAIPPEKAWDGQTLQQAAPETESLNRSGSDRPGRPFARLLSSRAARATLAVVIAAAAHGRRYLISVALHHLWYPSVAALLDPVTGRPRSSLAPSTTPVKVSATPPWPSSRCPSPARPGLLTSRRCASRP
jgi:hypothetical protein